MLIAPPREPAWLSWLYVILCAAAILATVPYARDLVNFFRENFGREIFLVIVYAAIILSLGATLLFLLRYKFSGVGAILWLCAVGGAFCWYTWTLRNQPEEALHFVEYGLLSLLLYRALSHHVRDFSIFLIATLAGAFFGAVDEALQWATPGRVWDMRDILINFTAVALIQTAIAMGLKPPLIERRFHRRSLPALFGTGFLFCAILGGSLLNTPAVINLYIESVPWLSQIKSKTSQMAEYGYLYRDLEIGIFRSRLAPDELAATDRARAADAASLLDAARGKEKYVAFIRRYTPLNDPFLHEARVHLWSRDAHIRQAEKVRKNDPERFVKHRWAAFRENQIVEKYFPNTLAASGYRLDPAVRARLSSETPADYAYESRVSINLITAVTEASMRVIVCAVLLILLIATAASWCLARRDKTGNGTAT